MFQNVLTNKHLTKEIVEHKLNKSINSIADSIVLKQRFGLDKNIDYIKAIRLKNYLPIIQELDNSTYLKYYFNTCDRTSILNKIGS